jgi:hypothetical protein
MKEVTISVYVTPEGRDLDSFITSLRNEVANKVPFEYQGKVCAVAVSERWNYDSSYPVIEVEYTRQETEGEANKRRGNEARALAAQRAQYEALKKRFDK